MFLKNILIKVFPLFVICGAAGSIYSQDDNNSGGIKITLPEFKIVIGDTYDQNGYDRDGYDRNGCDRNGYYRHNTTYYSKKHHDNGKHKGWYKNKHNDDDKWEDHDDDGDHD